MNPFDELFRRVEITCKARYHASSRLHYQQLFSQWTLTLLVVGQIVIALIPALGLNQNFSSNYLTFGSIFFAILVLAYSLLLGMGNYAARAIKVHECGMELGRLARNIYQHISPSNTGTSTIYDDLSAKYYNILEKYENHSSADYLRAHYEYYSGKNPNTSNAASWLENFSKVFSWWWDLQVSWIKAKIWLWMSYSHFLITIILIWGWIIYLIK